MIVQTKISKLEKKLQQAISHNCTLGIRLEQAQDTIARYDKLKKENTKKDGRFALYFAIGVNLIAFVWLVYLLFTRKANYPAAW